MSEKTREAGYIMRIGVMAFVLPIWAITSGFFLWEGMYLYAAVMLFFGALMGYGGYMNYRRLASDETIDDERMQKINWKSGFSGFWTMINTAILVGIFGGLIAEYLPVTRTWLMNYDSSIILGLGFIAYFGFRTYYLRYGMKNEFWRFN